MNLGHLQHLALPGLLATAPSSAGELRAPLLPRLPSALLGDAFPGDGDLRACQDVAVPRLAADPSHGADTGSVRSVLGPAQLAGGPGISGSAGLSSEDKVALSPRQPTLLTPSHTARCLTAWPQILPQRGKLFFPAVTEIA